MELILGSLVVGVVAGFCGKIPQVVMKRLNMITTVTLFIMLLTLGAQIGSDTKLLQNIPILGGRALTISLFAIGGSVLVLWLAIRYCQLTIPDGRDE